MSAPFSIPPAACLSLSHFADTQDRRLVGGIRKGQIWNLWYCRLTHKLSTDDLSPLTVLGSKNFVALRTRSSTWLWRF